MKTWVSERPDIAIMIENKIPSIYQYYKNLYVEANSYNSNFSLKTWGGPTIASGLSADNLLNQYGIKMTGYLTMYDIVSFAFINTEEFDSFLFLKEKINYLINIIKDILTFFNNIFFIPVTGEQKTIVAEYTEPLGTITQNNNTYSSELDWQIYEYSDGSKMATLSSYTNFPFDPCGGGTTASGSLHLNNIITIPPPSNFTNIQFVYGSRMFNGTGTHYIVNMPTGYDKTNNKINYRFFRTGQSSLNGYSGGAIYVYDGGESL